MWPSLRGMIGYSREGGGAHWTSLEKGGGRSLQMVENSWCSEFKVDFFFLFFFLQSWSFLLLRRRVVLLIIFLSFFVLYGTDKRLPYDVLFDSPKPLYSDDYNQVLLHMFQSIHQSVRKRLAASRAEMIQKQHLIATPVTLAVGDQVMKRSPDRQCKLAPKFIGPFLITEQLHGHKFKIQHVLSNASEVVHADRLKKVSALSP